MFGCAQQAGEAKQQTYKVFRLGTAPAGYGARLRWVFHDALPLAIAPPAMASSTGTLRADGQGRGRRGALAPCLNKTATHDNVAGQASASAALVAEVAQ